MRRYSPLAGAAAAAVVVPLAAAAAVPSTPPAGARWVPQDDALYADPATGRIFYYALSPDPVPDSGQVPLQDQLPAGYAELMTSGDDGASWTSSALPGYVESENPRFTSAPPPAGQPRQLYPTSGPSIGIEM